jgi:hypothetical protein
MPYEGARMTQSRERILRPPRSHLGAEPMSGLRGIDNLPKHIEITFRHVEGRYIVASEDGKIDASNPDAQEILVLTVQLVRALTRKRISCRIEAYSPLGPFLSQLRVAGAICRMGLRNPPALQIQASGAPTTDRG